MDWKNLFAHQKSDEGLIFRIYGEFQNSIIKIQITQLKILDLNSTSPKNILFANKHIDIHLTSLDIRKLQIKSIMRCLAHLLEYYPLK